MVVHWADLFFSGACQPCIKILGVHLKPTLHGASPLLDVEVRGVWEPTRPSQERCGAAPPLTLCILGCCAPRESPYRRSVWRFASAGE